MSIDTSIQTQSTQYTQSTSTTSTSSATTTGTIAGSTATQITNTSSMIADAAEELTFANDTTKEFSLSQRKERKSEESVIAERVKMYEELMNQIGKAHDLGELKKALANTADREEAREKALARFSDPSDAWAALKSTIEELKNLGAPKEVIEALEGAAADIENEHGPAAIQAGIHGALAAAGLADASELGGVTQLQGLYRDTVCDFGTVEDAFTHLQTQYGEVNFDKALDFLTRTLSDDLASDLPTMDRSHLESVNANLGQVRLLQSTHALCQDLVSRWENVHGQKDTGLNAMDFMKQFVALRSENYLGATHINRLAKQAKAPDIEHEVLFLQEVQRMGRNVTPQLFNGTEGRMRILDAIQDAVDKAIEREDEYLDSLG